MRVKLKVLFFDEEPMNIWQVEGTGEIVVDRQVSFATPPIGGWPFDSNPISRHIWMGLYLNENLGTLVDLKATTLNENPLFTQGSNPDLEKILSNLMRAKIELASKDLVESLCK